MVSSPIANSLDEVCPTRNQMVFGVIVEYPETPDAINGAEFNEDCPMADAHVPSQYSLRFRFIDSLAGFRALIDSLNERGARESGLVQSLKRRLRDHGIDTARVLGSLNPGCGESEAEASFDRSLGAFGAWVSGWGTKLPYPQPSSCQSELLGFGFLRTPEARFTPLPASGSKAKMGAHNAEEDASQEQSKADEVHAHELDPVGEEAPSSSAALFEELVQQSVVERLGTLRTMARRTDTGRGPQDLSTKDVDSSNSADSPPASSP
ncbi:hypothetical protein HK405_006675, partial [Cladochytrium tenue]